MVLYIWMKFQKLILQSFLIIILDFQSNWWLLSMINDVLKKSYNFLCTLSPDKSAKRSVFVKCSEPWLKDQIQMTVLILKTSHLKLSKSENRLQISLMVIQLCTFVSLHYILKHPVFVTNTLTSCKRYYETSYTIGQYVDHFFVVSHSYLLRNVWKIHSTFFLNLFWAL